MPFLSWCVVELAVGITSICIPSLFQLGKRWRQHGYRSLFSAASEEVLAQRSSLSRARPYSSSNDWEAFVRLLGDGKHEFHMSKMSSNSKRNFESEEHSVPGSINIRKDVVVHEDPIQTV